MTELPQTDSLFVGAWIVKGVKYHMPSDTDTLRAVSALTKDCRRASMVWIVKFVSFWIYVSAASGQEGTGGMKLSLPPDGSWEMEFSPVPVGVEDRGGVRVFRTGDGKSGVGWELSAAGAFSKEGKRGREWYYYCNVSGCFV